jgi:hypothetical protein
VGVTRFCGDVLERPIVQCPIRHHLLELAVLVLKLTQAPQLVDFEPAVLGFPAILRRVADACLPADVGQGLAAFDSFENADNLLFTEPTLAHVILSSTVEIVSHPLVIISGDRSGLPNLPLPRSHQCVEPPTLPPPPSHADDQTWTGGAYEEACLRAKVAECWLWQAHHDLEVAEASRQRPASELEALEQAYLREVATCQAAWDGVHALAGAAVSSDQCSSDRK